MPEPRKLEMKISLNALEHLGMNLYSNIPSVLSELVANAWDADATKVIVSIDKVNGTITIRDDGIGMDRDAVIDRFLTVGFRRRDTLGTETKSGRKPMGRKGIGKLSIFSIARIAEVHTRAGESRTAFRMDREDIKSQIQAPPNHTYAPEELLSWPSDLDKGTSITLTHLAKNLTGMTIEGLKRRIARRFSVIGSQFNFEVTVNGSSIGPADRGYHNAIQYIWTYGDQTHFVDLCKNLGRQPEARLSQINSELASEGLTLGGWIGTVSKPDQLKDDDGDNLNRLAVFMRGKLAQEDILSDFGQKEIYADYVVGELHCEELDRDTEEDIATSSRQTLKHDAPRFEALRKVVLSELRQISKNWNDWRRSDGAKVANTVPAVSDWLGALEGSTRRKAERWIGRLNTIRSSNEEDKKELLKASILAFESYRRKEDLERLEHIKDEGLEHILSIFKDVDDLERSYYGQIVKLRMGVISALQNKLEQNQKELVLRDFIFNHLWLLDPSWERTKGTEHAETRVSNFLKADTDSLKTDEKKARIDIGYRTTSGKHVIIELKRASVSTPVDDLAKQVRKYRDGAKKILEQLNHKEWPIEIIVLLGTPPPEWEDASGTGCCAPLS